MTKAGLCECGCGGLAPIAPRTSKSNGTIKGQPMRFILNHHVSMSISGSRHPNWKGGRIPTPRGYIKVRQLTKAKYVTEHVLIAEKVLGKRLPDGAVVHHANGNPSDNRNSNLVICDSQSYHTILHRRMRAYAACGFSHYRRCQYCHQYDDPKHLYIHINGQGCRHPECALAYKRRLRELKKVRCLGYVEP